MTIQLKDLFGSLIKDIKIVNSEAVWFKLITPYAGEVRIVMRHDQDCCEEVFLADGHEVTSMVGETLLDISRRTLEMEEAEESGTWTFFHIVTDNDTVVLRWSGQSNGYYSEEAELYHYLGKRWNYDQFDRIFF